MSNQPRMPFRLRLGGLPHPVGLVGFSNSAQPIRGFTLMEVLIAVAVSAILLVAVNGVFYGAIKLRERTSSAIEKNNPLQQTVAALRRDLRAILPPGGAFGGELKTAALDSGNGVPLGAYFYTGSGLIGDYLPWGNAQKVAYYLRTPTNDNTSSSGRSFDLVRSVTRNLLPQTQELVEEQWLMGGVSTVEFYFYDGDQWRIDWDSSTETPPLPKAVKVVLALAQERDRQEIRRFPIEVVVPISSQGSTNQTQTAGGQG